MHFALHVLVHIRRAALRSRYVCAPAQAVESGEHVASDEAKTKIKVQSEKCKI